MHMVSIIEEIKGNESCSNEDKSCDGMTCWETDILRQQLLNISHCRFV